MAAEVEVSGRGGRPYELIAASGRQQSGGVLTDHELKHSDPLCSGWGDSRCFIP